MIRAVLLDVYGTLIDIETDEASPRAWEAVTALARWSGLRASQSSLRRRSEEALRATRSRTEPHPECDVVAAFAAALSESGGVGPALDPVSIARVYRALTVQRLGVFADVVAALRRWRRRGLRIGYVSDAQRAFLDVELVTTGLAGAADVVVASSDHGYRKPDPRLFALALDALRVDPGDAVYVGDNPVRDVGGARAAGVHPVLLCRACAHESHALDDAPVLAVRTLAAVPLP